MDIHTLGPSGTNCEKVAQNYLEKHGGGMVHLHETLEEAAKHVIKANDKSLLLGCVVYPMLHELVFKNMKELELVECIVEDTYNMVMAARETTPTRYETAGSHPAPLFLLTDVWKEEDSPEVTTCSSNSNAAQRCAEGEFDVCITTLQSAADYGLHVVHDFGPVPMGFSIHRRK